MDPEEFKRHNKMLLHAVRLLEEHFDSVQILCSKMDGTTTQSFSMGAGNFYARLGQTREFLLRDKAQTELAELPEAEGEE